MSFLLMPNVEFSGSPLGKQVVSIEQRIAAIDEIVSHVNAAAGNYYTDLNSQLALFDLAEDGAEFVTASNRSNGPIIVENVLNGHNVIRFAGDKSQVGGLERTIANMPTGNAAISFACVARVTDTDAAETQHIMSTASVNSNGFNLYKADGNVRAQLNPGAVTLGASDGWQILIASAEGQNVYGLDVDDLSTVVSNTATSSNASSALFLGQHSLTGSKFIGDLAEGFVFNTNLLSASNANILATVITYFQTKFDL